MRAVGWITLIVLGVIALFVAGLVGRGCDTASRMADKTVFNADRHIASYEQFKQKYESYVQFQKQQEQAEARLAELAERGVTEGAEYSNLVMERDGSRQMMNRIAADYNAMSRVSYQAIWKEKGLPERLE